MRSDRSTIEFYRQRLPHWQPIGATFYVTFRLCGSIPKTHLNKLTETYQQAIYRIKTSAKEFDQQALLQNLQITYLKEYDLLLEDINSGARYLSSENIAEIVSSQMHRFDGSLYSLEAYCIMSNHVHMLIDTSIQITTVDKTQSSNKYVALDKIMKRIKGASARYCNQALSRQGQFWERESYDILVRDEKMYNRVVQYIANNPVKAGIVERWQDYRCTYVKTYE